MFLNPLALWAGLASKAGELMLAALRTPQAPPAAVARDPVAVARDPVKIPVAAKAAKKPAKSSVKRTAKKKKKRAARK